MAGNRVIYRPYFYEVFVLLNLIGIFLITFRESDRVLGTLPGNLLRLGRGLGMYMVAGVAIRLIVGAIRGNWRGYVRVIRRPAWIIDSVRLLVFSALIGHTYSWIKVLVPLYHPRLYDHELWELDRALFLGASPNIFLLTVFEPILWFFDWSYARIFFASLLLGFGFFLSEPSRRVRIGFATGSSVLWLTGAWIYMAIPSLGPVYRFPDVWFEYVKSLPWTQHSQALLMKNYQIVLRLRTGMTPPFSPLLGIAAFPSLHVGYQTYVFLWMRRLWVSGKVIFAIFVLIIFLGSVVTGWHYLIDSIAGILLALFAWRVAAYLWRLPRWLAVRRAVARSPAPQPVT